jgi:transcriptional regulator with XRE-family HTH domain
VPRRREPDPLALAFGQTVRRIRKERGESLLEVARRIEGNMDPKYLGEIELGYHLPRLHTAKRIADALEVGVADLVADL